MLSVGSTFLSRIARIAIVLATIVLLTVPGTRSFAAEPYGAWIAEKGVVLEIFNCNGLLCGRIVWLQAPLDVAGQPVRELENPVVALRPRLICGMTVLQGLRLAGPGVWDRGSFYDPRDGKRYSVTMKLLSDDEIVANIYAGSAVFGRTERLLRVLRLHTAGWC